MSPPQTLAPGRWRRLTSAERALAQAVFGAGLDTARLTLLALPVWRRAFVAGPTLIGWPATSARLDFAAPEVPLRLQAMFVHELAHVWQAQNGVNLLWAKLRAGDGPRAYAYDLASGRPFGALNIEQQAMMVEHAFLAAHGESVPHAGAAYAAALPAALPLALDVGRAA
ncbi:hypothetical protein CSW58_09380 [Caulobacter sp. B11]|uniref:hypothetical protein n=1 Tax=Caulobacter sp. B11 TaxID=2048899 RepID=UPI000C12C140|nr:hypothetical protein [Caulobacter sp. B11]PHY12923.1 hypothetical protein CSW58_09380 [Caulobacter sp. B11]